MNFYRAIVKETVDGQLKYFIREYTSGKRPSNFVCLAPDNLLPGDEKFLEYVDGQILVNEEAHAVRIKERAEEETRKGNDKNWNNKSIWQRIKDAYFA